MFWGCQGGGIGNTQVQQMRLPGHAALKLTPFISLVTQFLDNFGPKNCHKFGIKCTMSFIYLAFFRFWKAKVDVKFSCSYEPTRRALLLCNILDIVRDIQRINLKHGFFLFIYESFDAIESLMIHFSFYLHCALKLITFQNIWSRFFIKFASKLCLELLWYQIPLCWLYSILYKCDTCQCLSRCY